MANFALSRGFSFQQPRHQRARDNGATRSSSVPGAATRQAVYIAVKLDKVALTVGEIMEVAAIAYGVAYFGALAVLAWCIAGMFAAGPP